MIRRQHLPGRRVRIGVLYRAVGNTHVNTGTVSIGNTPTDDAELTVSLLTLFGGTIQIARNSALELTSNVTATSNYRRARADLRRRHRAAERRDPHFHGAQRVASGRHGDPGGDRRDGERRPHQARRTQRAPVHRRDVERICRVDHRRRGPAGTGAHRRRLDPGGLACWCRSPTADKTAVAVLTNDNISNAANVKVSAGGELRVDATRGVRSP